MEADAEARASSPPDWQTQPPHIGGLHNASLLVPQYKLVNGINRGGRRRGGPAPAGWPCRERWASGLCADCTICHDIYRTDPEWKINLLSTSILLGLTRVDTLLKTNVEFPIIVRLCCSASCWQEASSDIIGE